MFRMATVLVLLAALAPALATPAEAAVEPSAPSAAW